MASQQTETIVATQKAKSERVWAANSGWEQIYADAYAYAIPHRKPGGLSQSKRVADALFDMTAPESAMNLAGELQRLLFSQPPTLVPGALTKQAFAGEGAMGAKKLAQLERELERTGEFIYPFMEAGDLETATHEMCIDLGVGTGVIIPMRGTPDQPIIFHTPPADEVALGGDAYGRVNYVSWRRNVARAALLDAFPQGKFSDEFRKAAKGNGGHNECTLYQDFELGPDGLWRFKAFTDQHCVELIASETYRTKPIATPRYYRVAGEMRGRGPILIAMPSIKTVNTAQELALKAAAIQMLGIWAYRANSGFNPDTAALSPGTFWPMQSTGGILGPDVTRIDPASGRFDVAQLVIEGTQDQIRAAMMDTRLRPKQGTPASASEVAGLMSQNARVHLGGFMRLWREVHPDIIPRCAEILDSFGYLGGLMNFNQLIVSVGVRSPMAAALEADRVVNIARYAEMVGALVGPQAVPEHLVMDDALDEIGDALMIPKRLRPDTDQRANIREANAQQQQQAVLSEAAVKAAPQVAAGAFKVIEGGAGAQAA
jgi:hypothetical protein